MPRRETPRRALDRQIRAWALEEGIDVSAMGRIPVEVRARWEAAHPDTAIGVGVGEEHPGTDPVMRIGPELARPAETPPVAPGAAPKPTGGVHGLAALRERAAAAAAAAGPGKGKRTPVNRIMGGLWGLAGRVLSAGPVAPVGRVLQLQAPVAGAIADRIVRGTAIDRLLQPLARMSQRGDDLAALLGPPVIVAAIARNPAAGPLLYPMLREILELWADIAGPEMEKMQARSRSRAERGFDVDALIEALFASPGPGDEVPDEGTAA